MNTMNTYLDDFLNVKALEGCSVKTLDQYKFNINKFLIKVGKDPLKITTQDIRKYLSDYKKERGVSNVTLDNMRRNFTSFFTWLHNEGLIQKNPAAAVNKIKADKVIKNPFTEEEMEKLRESCKNLREKAIIEILYSTGMRIGELEALNKDDINWRNNSIIVFGKGAKERVVYLNIKSKIALQKYLDGRSDNNEALFVGLRPPYDRIKISTYESVLRELGKRCDVKCHPHKFRRTCATQLLNKGMPIQEVSRVLGHAKLETTMIYCTIDQESVATSHKKLMN
jgi:integrase/recombinase XerD